MIRHFFKIMVLGAIISIALPVEAKSTLRNITNPKPYLILQNPQYKDICQTVENFLNIPSTDKNSKELEFSHFIFESEIGYYPSDNKAYKQRPAYGAFECCAGGGMFSYLLVDVDNDGKPEVIDRSSGSANYLNTTIYQSVNIGSWIDKDDPDYEIITQYVFETLERAIQLNPKLNQKTNYNNFLPLKEFLQSKMARAKEMNFSKTTFNKIQSILQKILGEAESFVKSNSNSDHVPTITGLFGSAFKNYQHIKLQKVQYDNNHMLPYDENEINWEPFSDGSSLSAGVLEFFKQDNKNYIFFNNFLIQKNYALLKYYEEHSLDPYDMEYIRLSWKPEYYTPYDSSMPMDFKVAIGEKDRFKLVCMFRILEQKPDMIYNIY